MQKLVQKVYTMGTQVYNLTKQLVISQICKEINQTFR